MAVQENETLISLFKYYRLRAKLTKNKLAHEVGVNPSYLTRISNGTRGAPRYDVLKAMARGLKLSNYETDKLLVSAGLAPDSVMGCGWPEFIHDLMLFIPNATEEEITTLNGVIKLIIKSSQHEYDTRLDQLVNHSNR